MMYFVELQNGITNAAQPGALKETSFQKPYYFLQKEGIAAAPRNVCSHLHQAGLKGAAHRNKF